MGRVLQNEYEGRGGGGCFSLTHERRGCFTINPGGGGVLHVNAWEEGMFHDERGGGCYTKKYWGRGALQ